MSPLVVELERERKRKRKLERKLKSVRGAYARSPQVQCVYAPSRLYVPSMIYVYPGDGLLP